MDADIVAVASPKLKARRAIKTPADVAKFPLLHKTGSPSRWAGWMAEAGVTLDEAPHGHAYENFAMIALAAIAGLGLALLPRYLVDDDIAAKRLEIVAGEFVDIKSSYYLILPEIRSGSSAVQSFAKWLIAEAQAFNAADDAQPRKKEPIRRTNGKLKLPLRNGIAEYPRVAG
jgi:LysR family glycine cleavage system transcriptional activator